MRVVDMAERQRMAAGASVGLLMAIVFGLLAMHSLAMLDAGTHHESSMSLSAAAPMSDADRAPAPERAVPAHAPMPGGHVFMLCGVMMAATAAAAVAWLVLRRSPRHPALSVAAPRGGARARTSPRPRAGPPRYLTLSVCRC